MDATTDTAERLTGGPARPLTRVVKPMPPSQRTIRRQHLSTHPRRPELAFVIGELQTAGPGSRRFAAVSRIVAAHAAADAAKLAPGELLGALVPIGRYIGSNPPHDATRTATQPPRMRVRARRRAANRRARAARKTNRRS